MQRTFGITWALSEIHGWGLLGVHVALYLLDRGAPPILLEKPVMSTLRPANQPRIQPLLAQYRQMTDMAEQNKGKAFLLREVDMLHALSNGFQHMPVSDTFRGRRNIGVIAYEDTLFTPEIDARAKAYDFQIVHSTFNKNLLLERGVNDVRVTFQGVDPGEIYRMPSVNQYPGRFVVFSGGKLEHRKGQDIVLAAFKAFHQRHPDALLVTAWQNLWPGTAAGIAESPHAPAPPRLSAEGRVDIRRWALENGAPPDAFIDLGVLRRDQIPAVLAECHAAVFPNRCEGATNLVAMEAMACGVPCIMSANTGHLDLDLERTSFPLKHQPPVADLEGRRRYWGESSVEETVEALERIYTQREAAAETAREAQRFVIGSRTWRHFAESFVAAASA